MSYYDPKPEDKAAILIPLAIVAGLVLYVVAIHLAHVFRG